MKTLKITTYLVLFNLITLPLYAQKMNNLSLATEGTTYSTAIGLRGGETSGLTIKHFVSNKTAIEGIIGVWHHGFSGTVLLEQHQSAFNVAGLNWFYGIGGHISLASRSHVWVNHRGDRYVKYYDEYTALGVDAIVGLEYKIPRIPVALSLDVKPYVEVVSNGNVWMSLDPGLGIKIAF